jgi:hypothetical protein
MINNDLTLISNCLIFLHRSHLDNFIIFSKATQRDTAAIKEVVNGFREVV